MADLMARMIHAGQRDCSLYCVPGRRGAVDRDSEFLAMSNRRLTMDFMNRENHFLF